MRTPTAVRRLAVAALLPLALTGCGLTGGDGDAYGVQERTVTVDAGDEFTLSVPADPAMGQNWYLADPRPDADVVKYSGGQEDDEGGVKGTSGDDDTQYFDFEATGAGKATVKLLYCPNGFCHSAAEATASPASSAAPVPGPVPTATGTGAPDDRVEYYLYEITVR
ncbi:protease inhibitor I42 family protein [Streptomyces resistomycificus]|uniref:Proteinase inhibitor I42 chagasin domain-containing protein n=1 Tax=Streptomyces resistomycificus TaxID=67356 RepID=A0A0L8LFE9_9ACTN|nr:protease inhibitor I42 family protein [Streptomyces resistomycificus]KOG36978.1 hypothetical protein ADK37_13295 [Streptomyces resistomycificus]KUN96600.1 hypothetical protein AQJ84_19735 [Streptomyces resistomycificus]